MEKLDALASLVRVSSFSLQFQDRQIIVVEQLSDRVVRILGQNPGKFTLQGTNTYLIGENAPYTLIDTGEGRPGYIPLLESALEHGAGAPSEKSPRQHVSDIIISHWHLDHLGGLDSVLNLLRNLWGALNAPLPFQPPRIHKFPHAALPDESFQRAIQRIEPGMYVPSPSGSLFHDLHDGQIFPITSSDQDATFQVIHAPGHTEDSTAILFPSEQVLYTSDTVLGQGTTVFEDLGAYMSTLRSLLSYIDNGKETILYPGHGPVLHNGKQVIKSYIDHRMDRERQIVQVLQQPREDTGRTWSTREIVSKIYAAYPRDLWELATGSVNCHLQKLLAEGKVEKLGGEGKDTKWKLRSKL